MQGISTNRHTTERQATKSETTVHLPEEVWLTIFSHLGNRDLKTMCSVSKSCLLSGRNLLWHYPQLQTHRNIQALQKPENLKALAKLAVPIRTFSISLHFDVEGETVEDIENLVDCLIKEFPSLQLFRLDPESMSCIGGLGIEKLSHFMRLPVRIGIDTRWCLDMDFTVPEFLDVLESQVDKDIRLIIGSFFHKHTTIIDWRRLVKWPIESVDFEPSFDFVDYHGEEYDRLLSNVSPVPSLRVNDFHHVEIFKRTRIDDLRIFGFDYTDLEDVAEILRSADHPPRLIRIWFDGESPSVYDELRHLIGYPLHLKLSDIPNYEVDRLAQLVEAHPTIVNDIISCEIRVKKLSTEHAKRLCAAGLKFQHIMPDK